MFRFTTLTLWLLSSTIAFSDELPNTATQNPQDVAELSTINVRGQKSNSPKITTEKLLKVPGSGGDPLKAIEALPGVVLGGYGSYSVPAVRGSSPEDNIYITDFVPVGYVFHNDGGSTYNANLVQDFTLMAGAWGSEYYNALGSVMNTHLRDPYPEDLTTTLDLGVLRVGVLVEGGISDDSAFYASYRRSMLEYFVEDFVDENELTFTELPTNSDYQFKYHWRVNNSSNFRVTANGAQDGLKIKFGEESDALQHEPDLAEGFGIEGGYQSEAILFDTIIAGGTSTIFAISQKLETTDLDFGSLYDLTAKDYEKRFKNYYQTPLNNGDQLSYGIDISNNKVRYLSTGKFSPCNEDTENCPPFSLGDPFITRDTLDITAGYAFAKYNLRATPFLDIALGFGVANNDYLKGKTEHPRLDIRYELSNKWILTAAAGKHYQFPRPKDFRFIAKDYGNPDLSMHSSDHYIAGFEYNLDNSISAKVEVYYKDIHDLIVSNPDFNGDFENEKTYLNGATGKAYGLELLINKNLTDKWYGWLALAYSKTTRTDTLRDINFNYSYDRPWIANLVASYKKSKTTTYGWKWRYQSGNLFTPVDSSYPSTALYECSSAGVTTYEPAVDVTRCTTDVYLYAPNLSDKNSERLPASHRLDFRIDYQSKPDSSYYLEILNVYNQLNVTEYKYNVDYTEREKVTTLPTIISMGMKLVY